MDARWSIWLLSLAAVACFVTSAPLNNDAIIGTPAAASNETGSDFDAAIAEIRAKREALRKKSRFAFDESNSSEEDGSREDDVADLLARIDSPAELNSLAKEIALDILMEENKERMKNKKKKLNLDDDRRKRANSLFNNLMEGEDDESDEYEENDDDEREMIRALANQGLEYNDIEDIIAQLDDGEDKRKKKRGGERWKLPRGGLRWRSSHYFDPDEDDDVDEGRFFGRGFHRMGHPGVLDEMSRSAAGSPTDKRMLRPLRTRGVIKKRSPGRQTAETRKKRSVSSAEAVDSNQNDTTPPRALPVTGKALAADETAHNGAIRKKSVDWDDYFGYDKRKRSRKGDEGEEDDAQAIRDYLESREYYKAIAGSLAYRKKRADHSGHVMKKSNSTRPHETVDRLRARLIANLIGDLEPEDVEEMSERLTHDLVSAMRDDDDEFDEDERRRKRLPVKKRTMDEKRKRQSFDEDKRRKRPIEDEDKRRKRLPIKRRDPDDDECVIAEQVVATCDMVSHLYGGYRPVLSDACFRHQACSICSDSEEACDVDYQRRVMALCGPDLLCQSQSRHLLTALNQLDEMEAGLLGSNQRQIEALCRRDACLADLYKRR